MQPLTLRQVVGFELCPLVWRYRSAADAENIADVAVVTGMVGTGVFGPWPQ
jgi:hypothetical protein